MDVVQLGPENNQKFSYTHEHNPSMDSTALRPAQCHVDDSWSTVGTQVLVTSESIVEQQSVSWSPSRDMDRVASMKIFTSVMLHAWRQRRADVRRLQQVVERLQRKVSCEGFKIAINIYLYVIFIPLSVHALQERASCFQYSDARGAEALQGAPAGAKEVHIKHQRSAQLLREAKHICAQPEGRQGSAGAGAELQPTGGSFA